ncbi:PLP-dependent aminotransferase family protein [Methylocystis bryophila]|uniref:Transcriptional regulator n=1 Tax=Methylocystis bryophila TaxID=655015 RepID=A0A1W6MVD3_9HYPH|nr:PLP-dependent aminotransferase family protein [Methylocystis bryophila]ARN81476.1 transcriptional regulator [Methylocystis bryophila]BDV37490.1 transcriptional regulator [Methylocystis bryophila]
MRRAEEREFGIAARPSHLSLQRWLYGELREAILAGRLSPGSRLPASRDFARQHGVSRGVVLIVFAQLTAEGYLIGRVGKGTFVSEALPLKSASSQTPERKASPNLLSRRGRLLAQSPFPIHNRPKTARPFRPHQPDIDAFPLKVWNRIAARRSGLLQRQQLQSGDARGFGPLRQAIADHLRYSMRVSCDAEQVMMLGSAQQGLDLCARLLLDPGDEVWVEDPGYMGARDIFAAAGAKVVAVPVDAEGADVSVGVQRAPRARLAYVTPAHQTPLGMSMALERRLALLRWSRAANAVVIEDDYDGEYRYTGRPLAPLKSLDEDDRVIYAGTFSKLLFPSLRLAYLVVPDRLADAFAAALSLSSRHQSLLPQIVLHEFIAEGHFARHLREMRILYGERARQMEKFAASRLSGLLTLPRIATGLDASALLPNDADDRRVAAALLQGGIEARAISEYRLSEPAPSGLVLGFAAFGNVAMEEGVARVAEILERLKRGVGDDDP